MNQLLPSWNLFQLVGDNKQDEMQKHRILDNDKFSGKKIDRIQNVRVGGVNYF